MILLEKIRNWTQYGPQANDKHRNSGWGMPVLPISFGHAKRTKYGTIRRATKEGQFSNVPVPTAAGSEIIAGGSERGSYTKHGKKQASQGTQGLPGWEAAGGFAEEYTKETYRDPYTEFQEEFTPLKGEAADLFEGTSLENVALPTGLTEDIGAAEASRRTAEVGYETQMAEAQTLKEEGEAGILKAESTHQAELKKLSAVGGQAVKGGIKGQMAASAAGSRTGFGYSGAVERLRDIGAEATKVTLKDIEAQKTTSRDTRRTSIDESQEKIKQAARDVTGAEVVWDEAKKTYEQAYTGTGGFKDAALGTVQTMIDNVTSISDADRIFMEESQDYGKYTGDLWEPASKSQELKDVNLMIEDARSALIDLTTEDIEAMHEAPSEAT